ncbi:MAG: L-threonylcarbamoyladenylate synthase [Blastocatellia bacterium]|jgi:L-threonylcarbamoyladenylate synthase|nr:L-threonylcarbamoyladenylate synthase [Blastocatellia bacterium]
MLLPYDEKTRELAARTIAAGGVLAFRTDTFYGLGADPFNPLALRKIYALKGREDGKPLLVIISDAAITERLMAAQSKLFEAVAARHWPGPITLVGQARQEIPEELTAGTGTIGVRLPDDEPVREFVRAMGGALTATSANPSGTSPARTALEVEDYFPNGLDLIIDTGPAPGGLPSTVLDASGPTARLIREGAVSREELGETLERQV